MIFSDLIEAFGKYVNAEIEINDGTVSFDIDDMPIIIMDAPELDSIILCGQIGEPPPVGLEQLFSAMLTANHNFRGTAGATISINPDNGNFELCRYIPVAATNNEKFIHAVEQFVNVMETWSKAIKNYRPKESVDDSVTKSGDLPSGINNLDGFLKV